MLKTGFATFAAEASALESSPVPAVDPKPIALPDLTPLHAAVGRGISIFASIEFGVGMCFASMMEPAPRKVSVATLNAARSFEAKMKLIDATAEARLKSVQLRKWRSISNSVGKRRLFRHKLAHWMVSHYPGMKAAADFKRMKPALVPPFWSKAHAELYWSEDRNQPVRPVLLKQVLEFHDISIRLFDRLMEFSELVRSATSAAKVVELAAHDLG